MGTSYLPAELQLLLSRLLDENEGRRDQAESAQVDLPSVTARSFPPSSGIFGNAQAGCWSIALSGGWADDVDNGGGSLSFLSSLLPNPTTFTLTFRRVDPRPRLRRFLPRTDVFTYTGSGGTLLSVRPHPFPSSPSSLSLPGRLTLLSFPFIHLRSQGTKNQPKNLRVAPQTFDQSFDHSFNAALKVSSPKPFPLLSQHRSTTKPKPEKERRVGADSFSSPSLLHPLSS